ncbi:MAG: hypothetical protein AAGM33_00020 [Pseudomonadota bacterium]
MALQKLNSLWVGNKLSYLERLCLVSGLATGHEFTLWSYEPEKLEGVPDGVELRDAAEVMPRDRLLTYADTGSVALGANFWRYELLARDLGYWVDMDFYFLRPFDFAEDHVFGWEYEGWVNNAVLLAPAGSAMVHDLNTIPQPNQRPPWFGPKRSLAFYWQRLTKGPIGLDEMPWGTYASGLVTHVIKKNRIENHARPPTVFYPVRWKDARALYEPAEVVEGMLADDTCAVHMWHSRLVGLFDKPPAPGSYIDVACRKHDIDTSW